MNHSFKISINYRLKNYIFHKFVLNFQGTNILINVSFAL